METIIDFNTWFASKFSQPIFNRIGFSRKAAYFSLFVVFCFNLLVTDWKVMDFDFVVGVIVCAICLYMFISLNSVSEKEFNVFLIDLSDRYQKDKIDQIFLFIVGIAGLVYLLALFTSLFVFIVGQDVDWQMNISKVLAFYLVSICFFPLCKIQKI